MAHGTMLDSAAIYIVLQVGFFLVKDTLLILFQDNTFAISLLFSNLTLLSQILYLDRLI